MILLDSNGHPIDQTLPIGPPVGDRAPATPFPPYFEASMTITDFNVYFSPAGGARAALIAEIDAAVSTIRVAAFEFTDITIAVALKNAVVRGVAVEVIMDGGRVHYQSSDAGYLKDAGCIVYVDNAHRVMHQQVMVIDDAVLCTGSFHYAAGAESSHAENLFIFAPDASLIATFNANLDLHVAHSVLF